MNDSRLWLILSLNEKPKHPIKYYISMFPKSRGSFFKAKAMLMDEGVIRDAQSKRGYLELDREKAQEFFNREYPGLVDAIACRGATCWCQEREEPREEDQTASMRN